MQTQQGVLLSNLLVVQHDWGEYKLQSKILSLQQHRFGSGDMPFFVRRVFRSHYYTGNSIAAAENTKKKNNKHIPSSIILRPAWPLNADRTGTRRYVASPTMQANRVPHVRFFVHTM